MLKISRLPLIHWLLGFLLFHIQGADRQVFLNPWEILVDDLFFNEISALQPANAIKAKFLKFFKGFACCRFNYLWCSYKNKFQRK